MRGMTANIVGFSSAVALLVDGVPTLRGQGFGDSLLGAQSVEVLRGPQSTLYGRNAQAGVISVVTRQPGDAPYALLSAEGGSRRRAVLRADASRALKPGRAYLGVAGEFMRQDGFIRNLHTGRREDGRQQYNGRLTLRLTPSARTEINLRASARRDDDGASAWGAVAAPRATVRSGWPGSNTSRGHTLSADVTHDFGGGLRLQGRSRREKRPAGWKLPAYFCSYIHSVRSRWNGRKSRFSPFRFAPFLCIPARQRLAAPISRPPRDCARPPRPSTHAKNGACAPFHSHAPLTASAHTPARATACAPHTAPAPPERPAAADGWQAPA